jgi:hypothetical protein
VRAVLLLGIAMAAATLGVGGANAAVFQADAGRAQASIAAAERAGVPASELTPLREQLALRSPGPLAWPLTPALLRDPFADVTAGAGSAWWRARDAASLRAWHALTALQEAEGGSDWSAYYAAFRAADGPAAFDALAATWTWEKGAADLERSTLAELGGGLSDGRPKDLVDLIAVMEDAAAQAQAGQLDTNPAGEVRALASQYWALDFAAQLEGHDALKARLQNAVDRLKNRVYAWNEAVQLAGDLDRLVLMASGLGVSAELRARVDEAKALTAAARDDPGIRVALDKAQSVSDALGGILYQAAIAPPPMPPCLEGKPAGQIIVLHLNTQVLYAYQDGCPVQAAKITTGRAALPTPHGTFWIFYKAPRYHMISPWPLGSPFWYPPTWVDNAMEFISDGTFIHSADWQPDSTYGAGSQYGPYSSHGCVHVQDGPLAQLYAWAQIGTQVRVED